jgi:autotransporter-associated beta strand protein
MSNLPNRCGSTTASASPTSRASLIQLLRHTRVTHSPGRSLGSISLRYSAPTLRIARKIGHRGTLATLALFTLCGFNSQALAATDTWSSTPSTGAWGTAANWSDAANTVPATGDSLVFGASTITSDTDNLMTPSTYSIAGITFNSGAPAYIINPGVIGTNGFTLTGNITNSSTSLDTINDLITTTAVRTITMTSGGGNVTLGGNISGAGGGFTLAGTGVLTLSGSNSYTGAVTIAATSALQLQANAGNTSSTGSSSAMATQSVTASQLASGATIQFRADSTVASGGVVAFDSGAAEFGVNSSGNRLPGTYNFDVNQLTTGSNLIVEFGPTNAVGASTGWQLGNASATPTINVTGGNGYSLELDGFNVGNNDPLVLNPTTANLIVGPVLGGTGIVTKSGAGTLTFTGANSYTGSTNITGGILNFQNGTALGTNGAITVSSGATAQVQGGIAGGAKALSLAGAGATGATGALENVSGVNSFGGLIALTAATTISSDAGTLNLTNAGTIAGSGDNLALAGAGNGSIAGIIGTGAGTLTKSGTGTWSLSGVNTYTGTTSVNGGTLALTGAGSINGSGITVNGIGAKFLQTSSAAGTSAITLTQGTLDGTGSVGVVTVGAGTGGIVANGNGASAALALASLDFSGAGALSLNQAGGSSTTSPSLLVSGLLTTPGSAGSITVNLNAITPFVNGSTYDLVSLGSYSGLLTDFTIGTGLSGRQANASSFGMSGGFLTLTVNGDSPVWTGTSTGIWTTAATNSSTSGTPNWTLLSTHAATDFWAADTVQFNDTVTTSSGVISPTNVVKIEGGSVSPISMIFNNNILNYTIQSGDGSGIAAGTLIMNGIGSVTLTSTNTYTGVTTINAGTLNLASGGSLKSTAITVGTGSAFNESSTSTVGGLASLTTSGNTSLSGSNSFTGATNINAGTLALASGGSLNGSAVTVATSGTLTEATTGAITGGVSLTTSGNTTLSGNNSYTGATNVNSGSLALTSGGTINGSAVSVASGAVLTEAPTSAITGGISLTTSGNTTLSGSNSFTGATNINAGTLALASGGSLDGSAVTVATSGTLTEATTGAITGGVSLTTSGNTTLSGSNNYSGATNINAGTLALTNGGSLNGTAITDGTGAIFTEDATSSIAGSGVFTMDTGGAATIADGNTNFTGSITVGSSVSVGTVTDLLIEATQGLGTGNLTITGNSDGAILQLSGNGVSLNNPIQFDARTTATQVGIENVSGNNSLSGPITGVTGGGFYVVQSDSGTLSLTGNVILNHTLVVQGNGNGLISGVVSDTMGDTGGVTMSGLGTWTLSAANTYTGPTAVNSGTLVVSGSLSATTVASVLGAGKLEVDGVLNNGISATVSGELSGTGLIGGAAVSGVGATLAPGLTEADSSISVGTLTASGNVSLASSATFSIRLGLTTGAASNSATGLGGDVDQLLMNGGTFSLADNTTTLQILDTPAEYSAALDSIYVIVNGGANAPTGAFANAPVSGDSITAESGGTYDVFYDVNAANSGAGNDIVVELVAVPEPGTCASLLGGLGVLIAWQRSRRRRA